ncbi:MAG: DNA polymerase Y family protein [Gemmatimonadales bacterium]
MPKTIFYIDPPAFCTTVEQLVAPALRTRPLAVAPPGADRATVLALSPEARAAGITRGMPVRRARKLCPDLVLLPPNPRLYARASRALGEILRVYAPIIEPRGYGHAFLDLTGTERLFGPPVDVAERIRREARDRLRLPLTVGVATNKLVSEAATRSVRPGLGKGECGVGSGGLRVNPHSPIPSPHSPFPILPVQPGAEAEFLAPNPLSVLPEVPDDIRQRLEDYQLELIGQVAAISESQLATVFGRRGRLLRAQARGLDPRPVLPPEVRAEYRLSHVLATDTNDLDVLDPLLRLLTETLGHRLRRRGLAAHRLLVQVEYTDYQSSARSMVPTAVPLDQELWTAARRALRLVLTRRVAVRTVTLMADRLVEANRQLDLFDAPPAESKAAELQMAIDRVNSRRAAVTSLQSTANRNSPALGVLATRGRARGRTLAGSSR